MTPTRLRFQLNTFRSGPQAWFFLAQQRGYLAEEGIELEFIDGDTAANTVPRMARDGLDAGYGDFNALVEHVAHGKPNAPLAVFMAYNRSPYTLAVAADSAITHPQQLAGQRLVSHHHDAAWLLYGAFAEATGLDPASTPVEFSDAPHSELVPRLLNGEWAGQFGFVNTLRAAAVAGGVDPARLRHFDFATWVPPLYGMALMVSRPLAQDKPEVVRGLLRALNRGLHDTVAEPAAAIDALAANAPGLHRPSNALRLAGTLTLEMGGTEGGRLGIGEVDDARLAASIGLIARTKPLPREPAAAELFSRAFLPPLAERVRSLASPG